MFKFLKSLIAAGMILSGLYLVIFGNTWGPRVFELLPDTEVGFWLELIVPFLPIGIIALGAALFVAHRR